MEEVTQGTWEGFIVVSGFSKIFEGKIEEKEKERKTGGKDHCEKNCIHCDCSSFFPNLLCR